MVVLLVLHVIIHLQKSVVEVVELSQPIISLIHFTCIFLFTLFESVFVLSLASIEPCPKWAWQQRKATQFCRCVTLKDNCLTFVILVLCGINIHADRLYSLSPSALRFVGINFGPISPRGHSDVIISFAGTGIHSLGQENIVPAEWSGVAA